MDRLKDDGEPYSILTKYFSQEEFQSLLDAVDGKPGDFILFCADQFPLCAVRWAGCGWSWRICWD